MPRPPLLLPLLTALFLGIAATAAAQVCVTIDTAKDTFGQADRDALYKKAQVIFKEQAPWFTIAHAVQLKPVRKEVIDFKLSPFGRHNFYGVDMAK